MTKTDEIRAMTWRHRLLQRAADGSRNVAAACRHFGVSRKTFYKWKKRQEAGGDAALCDRARTPHRVPNATPRDVVTKMVYLRQTYHFGPRRIADYLKRFHQVSVAVSTVHRILGRHGLNRLPANQKYRPHGSSLTFHANPQGASQKGFALKSWRRCAG